MPTLWNWACVHGPTISRAGRPARCSAWKSRSWPGRKRSYQPPIELTGTRVSATRRRWSAAAQNGSSALCVSTFWMYWERWPSATMSARANGSVRSARLVRRACNSWRSSAKRRSWLAISTPHWTDAARPKPSARRNSRDSADSVACVIIALTCGGSRSATAHCT